MTEHAYTDHTSIPPRQPAGSTRSLDRSRAVQLTVEAYPIAEAAKLGSMDNVWIYVTDGEIGAWLHGAIHEGEPVIGGFELLEEQGFAPVSFALSPAAPVDGVTV